jgi:hypothetical protein
MIAALMWAALTAIAGWILHKHHMFSSAMPALAVLAWWAAACVGLSVVIRRAREASTRRAARFNADKEALIKAAKAELARQSMENEGQGRHA